MKHDILFNLFVFLSRDARSWLSSRCFWISQSSWRKSQAIQSSPGS